MTKARRLMDYMKDKIPCISSKGAHDSIYDMFDQYYRIGMYLQEMMKDDEFEEATREP